MFTKSAGHFLCFLLIAIGVGCGGQTAEEAEDLPALAEVTHLLYLLDFNLDDETIDQIVSSDYDMVVMEPITTEENNTDFPIADVVERLHNASQPKLVIAYIDIGQAEDYRTYWQPGWGIGNPDWIVANDPDGWVGNYPVAFWREEWKEIWVGNGGYLQAILDAGFDGIYLDWVEAYSDENVTTAATADSVDPRSEMIQWVGELASFSRAQRSGFLVIGQNAAELAQDATYRGTVNAIAQEQTWFDGAADNDPPGDCPLPETDADVETEAYVNSLSAGCREMHDDFPDSTLHTSTEEYLGWLTSARDLGVIVFTVDYALEPENVAFVYEESRSLGFVPFVGERSLSTYLDPVP